MKEVAEREAVEKHNAEMAAAQEAVRQLIEQNRPRVERREQLIEEKEEKRRQKEVQFVQF